MLRSRSVGGAGGGEAGAGSAKEPPQAESEQPASTNELLKAKRRARERFDESTGE